jgi:YVTN family beta-propeller protein
MNPLRELFCFTALIIFMLAACPKVLAAGKHAAEDELAAAAAVLSPAFNPKRDAITIEKLRAKLTSTAAKSATTTQAAAFAAPTGPDFQGSWGAVIPWTPHIPVTAALLPNGKLLTFASNQPTTFPSGPEFTFAAVWDPATGQFTEVNNNRHDMFCGGTAFLPDGRLVINGGRNTTVLSSVFDWNTNQWSALPNMNDPRWYNTSVALPDGGVFTVSGSGGPNTAERWDAATGWRRMPGIGWSTVTSEPGYITNWHPFLMLAPNGKLFHFGPTDKMNWVETNGNGTLTNSGQTIPGTQYPKEGSWGMYNEGQIVVAGGGASTTRGSDSTTGTSSAAAYKVDLRNSTPLVTSTSPMTFARQFANTVILPNGEVMVIGGNGGIKFSDAASVLTPEIWNPSTNVWRTVANHATPRNYHSVALLLPDGRVWSGGGGLGGNAADHRDAEIFTPPSLYDVDGSLAVRPKLTSAPSLIGIGAQFSVTATPSLSRFTMIRLSSQTHSVNTDLRFLDVPFSETTPGNYQLTAHSNINVMAPGYWMLFGLNSSGVHSVAKIFKVDQVATLTLANPGNQTTSVGSSVSLAIAAVGPAALQLTYNATGLPPGLTINSATGIISGKPTVAGLFNVTVTVAGGALSQSRAFTWTVSPTGSTWQFTTFTGTSGLTLNGAAKVVAPVLRLTPATTNQRGTAFLSQSVPVMASTSFKSRFVFKLSGANIGGDGLTFVIQGNNTTQLGVAGGGLGFQGILKSLAVEIDSYAGTGDPNKNHVGVLTGGNVTTHLATHTPTFDLEDGLNHTAWVEYDGTLKTLQVYLSQANTTVRPTSPVITLASINLQALVGSQAWFGFSAGTGGFVNAHDITSWDLALDGSAPPPPSLPPVVTNPGNQVAVRGTPVSLQILASDPENDNLSYAAAGLPAGLTIGASTGLIAGIPTVSGSESVSISVSDGKSPPVTTNFTWLVSPPLSLPSTSGPIVSSGASVNYTISATGGNAVRYKWDFGDGSAGTNFSSTPGVSYTYTKPGRYLVTVTATDATGRTVSSGFYQGVSAPTTLRAPTASNSIIFEARATGNSRIWVVNPDSNSVTVLDAVTLNKLAETAVGAAPSTLALAPDGRVWVACPDSAVISILNPSTFAVVQTLPQARGSRPFGIAFDPNAAAAWLTLEGTGSLLKLNPSTGALLANINLGPNVRHLSVNADGSRIFVSRFVTPLLPGEATANIDTTGKGGEVMVVDSATSSVVRKIILQHSDALDTANSGGGIPNYLGAPVISPDGLSAWIPSKQDNIKRGKLRDGNDLTHESAVRAIASRIDLTKESEDYPARIDFDNAGTPTAMCYDPTGIYGFVTLEGSRAVTVMDVWNRREITRFPAGRAPDGLTLSADGRTLFVQNFMDRSVTVHNVSGILNGGIIPPTVTASLSTTTEKLSPQVLLGKQHFYDAKDNRLALQEYISCASCHKGAGHDGRVWDFTGFGEGLRNTITLLGHANQGVQHWTGNFDEVQDFENQIRNFAGGLGLISNGSPNLPLGAPNAGRSADLDALAAYVGSLTVTGDSPARSSSATLPAAALSGRTVFKTQNCASCHSGSQFTNSAIGVLRNVGTIKPSTGKRLNTTLTGLDVPTLRGLWATAPYLHDGSAATISDAIRVHSGVSLAAADLSNLAAYLNNLDDAIPFAPAQLTALLTTASSTASIPFQVTATFSGPATGFTRSDIIVTNGTASGLTGSGAIYTFTITPAGFGNTTISIGASTVTDSDGDGNLQSNILSVAIPSGPPVVTTPVSQNSERGASNSLQIVASSPDALPLRYSAIGLPPGMTINADTGLIAGAPNTSGIYQTIITVTGSSSASTTVSFSWTVIPAVLSAFAENFNATAIDASRWVTGSTYGEMFAPVDPLITVVQKSGRLEVTPRNNTSQEGYRGLVSLDVVNLRDASVTVDVTPAGGTADTWLALGSGVGNFLVIGREGTVLWLEQMINGVRDVTLFNYVAANHRQWRIRHDAATDRILFQLSPDGVTWTTARSINRNININSMRIELAAGSFQIEPSAGTALFDNVRFTPTGIAPVISSFTASPQEFTVGGSSTLNWTVSPGTAPLTSLTLNGVSVIGATSSVINPTTTTSYTLAATSAVGTTTSATLVIVRQLQVGNSYASWSAAFGGSGIPADDTDGDSYPEGLEYAIARDPASGSAFKSTVPGASPAISRAVRMESSKASDGTRRFDLVFTRPRTPLPDIGSGYWLETSTNLETWTATTNLNGGSSVSTEVPQIIVTNLGDGTEEVRAGFPVSPALYVRLAVYLPTSTVRSAPFGWMGRDIHVAENLIAPPFARESVHGGNYTWAGSAFRDNSVAWSPGQWNGHFVQITSGSAAGAMLQITGNTANTLSFTGEPAPLLGLLNSAPSGTYVIRASHTLASLFGADNREQLVEGDSTKADSVSFLNSNGSFSDYYFLKSGVNATGWRTFTDPVADVSGRTMSPTTALFLGRSNPAISSIQLFGEVILGRRLIPIRPGICLPGTWNVVEKSTLQNLGFNGFFTASSTPNNNTIYIEFGTQGGLFPHYLKTGVGWRSAVDDSNPMGSQTFQPSSSWLLYPTGSEGIWSRNPGFNYTP